jgi:Flp pilus assembly protein TadG
VVQASRLRGAFPQVSRLHHDTTEEIPDMRKPSTRQARGGAALVEFAFVASALVLILFGILEYARYIFLLQVCENAAREGARFAVVHTGDGTTKQDIIDEVTRRMAGREKEVTGFTVDVVNVNPSTGATISATWNSAAFGQSIEVRITGTYSPILPVFLKTSTSIPVRAYSMMSSEAN